MSDQISGNEDPGLEQKYCFADDFEPRTFGELRKAWTKKFGIQQ